MPSGLRLSSVFTHHRAITYEDTFPLVTSLDITSRYIARRSEHSQRYTFAASQQELASSVLNYRSFQAIGAYPLISSSSFLCSLQFFLIFQTVELCPTCTLLIYEDEVRSLYSRPQTRIASFRSDRGSIQPYRHCDSDTNTQINTWIRWSIFRLTNSLNFCQFIMFFLHIHFILCNALTIFLLVRFIQ